MNTSSYFNKYNENFFNMLKELNEFCLNKTVCLSKEICLNKSILLKQNDDLNKEMNKKLKFYSNYDHGDYLIKKNKESLVI